jgi:hypothetical protein
MGNDLTQQPDWLQQVHALSWVQREADRLNARHDRDGRLDSSERVICERAYIDPLYQDDEEVTTLSSVDRYSLDVAQHSGRPNEN